ncbi:MAG: ribonuclease D, partial [Planctomycetaceae bacterium]
MTEPLIVEAAAFDELCDHIERAGLVAFDTEFVSEFTYRPELGLLQFATAERLAAVDPYAVTDLGRWWRIMAGDEVAVIVHGGQAEVRFCRVATGERPRRLVDVQLAEGMRSRSYPLGYGPLVARVLGKRVSGKETRSDWRARPLSPRQIRYALEDVEHVLKIWDRQRVALESLGRLSWAEQEFERLIDETIADLER